MTIAEIVVPLNTQNGWDREPAIAIERRLVRHRLDKALDRMGRLDEKLRFSLTRKTAVGSARCRGLAQKVTKLIEQIELNDTEIELLCTRIERLGQYLAA